MRVRKSALNMADWDPILLWYARAVAVMKTRPITDPMSWRYQAAIHDYIPGLDPFRVPGEAMPTAAEQAKFWRKCQHGSWFFLPWHRAYLLFFERIVAKTIVSLGGPPNWALPYWNYSVNNNARRLPKAFQSPTLPDGSPNALFVSQRVPAANSNLPVGSAASSSLTNCMSRPLFINGALAQFGGGRTGFSHGGSVAGACEITPHGSMHVAVGGPGGFMSAFNTAALDPIFWLHHANIDRLWSRWVGSAPGRINPTEAAWLTGTAFDFRNENGTAVVIRCNQMVNLASPLLDYQYEAIVGPGGVILDVEIPGGRMPNPDVPPELLGASSEPITLSDEESEAKFDIQRPTGPAAGVGLTSAGGAPVERGVHLVLENVRAQSGPVESYEVYVNVPAGEKAKDHPELMAGLMPAFGVVESSQEDNEHGGSGVHFSLDITAIVSDLEARGLWDPAALRVAFVPHRSEGDRDPGVAMRAVEVGRVSLYFE